MRSLRSWPGLLGSLTLACLPARAGAQPVGSEFQVNTYTTSHQVTRCVGGRHLLAGAAGNFVVVWDDWSQDGGLGIFGQRFDSAGGKLGSEFRVNSYTTSVQFSPSVASDASGGFVVVWWSQAQDGSGEGIFSQRYDSTGGALGSEFRVNSYTTSHQDAPSVASDASGNFIVVWSGPGNGDGSGVFGQRFDSAGGALGSEFRVNSYTTDRQTLPSVASDASGDFVVVWQSLRQDGDRDGVFGQRYDSDGETLGGEFRVNTYTTLNQYDASVVSDASGNFVVVWESPNQRGIFGQRYDSEGEALGDEFQVDSYTLSGQQNASVGATGVNQFVVVWDSYGQDGSGYGVFGRRFDFASGTITVVRPNTNVKWLIGSVKEIRWTHTMGLSATFRIELDRNDDGTFEELIAAAAPAETATSGSFAWTVTGPPSSKARVRVSWTDDLAVSDASDVTFRIKLEG